MTHDEPHQALTSERLAEIRAVCFHQEHYTTGEMGPPDSLTVSMALDDLLADNERLRAREAALLAVARLVANIPDSEYSVEYPDGVYLPARRVRATLWASTDIRQQARAAEGSSSYGE